MSLLRYFLDAHFTMVCLDLDFGNGEMTMLNKYFEGGKSCPTLLVRTKKPPIERLMRSSAFAWQGNEVELDCEYRPSNR